MSGCPLPLKRHDLPARSYPFTIEALIPGTDKVVWSKEVAGPGPVHIPALRKQLGHPVAMRFRFADGTVTTAARCSDTVVTVSDSPQMCHCGQPLHYASDEVRAAVQRFVDDLGPCIKVSVDRRTWLVPRHYIALHGIRGADLERLGFEEITS